jgi:hypothetical protein
MKAICTDMAAEQQALDAIFTDLDEPGWNIVTPVIPPDNGYRSLRPMPVLPGRGGNLGCFQGSDQLMYYPRCPP